MMELRNRRHKLFASITVSFLICLSVLQRGVRSAVASNAQITHVQHSQINELLNGVQNKMAAVNVAKIARVEISSTSANLSPNKHINSVMNTAASSFDASSRSSGVWQTAFATINEKFGKLAAREVQYQYLQLQTIFICYNWEFL